MNPICFWARGTERYAFLHAVQHELTQTGLAHRLDSGWDEFDVEISTNRWSTAQLTTVHEELAEGRRFFRCRITTRLSWTTWLLVTALAVGNSFTVLMLREELPYVWFAFALVPIALLFVGAQERAQSETIASVVSTAAHRLGFEEWMGHPLPHPDNG